MAERDAGSEVLADAVRVAAKDAGRATARSAGQGVLRATAAAATGIWEVRREARGRALSEFFGVVEAGVQRIGRIQKSECRLQKSELSGILSDLVPR